MFTKTRKNNDKRGISQVKNCLVIKGTCVETLANKRGDNIK
ncbi:hypothetical protein [Desulfallas sp. Bu1-1]|nr:hypothetical protein [Desulfallas sp. Bu1-1]